MDRLRSTLLLMLSSIAWPILCLAQPLQTDDREQLHFPTLRHCSEERSTIVLRFRHGAISLEMASGPNATIRVSPTGDRIVFVLGRGECRIAGMISRPNESPVDDIESAVSRINREMWPEMHGDVQILPPTAGCMHMLIQYSLASNLAERVIQSSLPDASAGYESCVLTFLFAPIG